MTDPAGGGQADGMRARARSLGRSLRRRSQLVREARKPRRESAAGSLIRAAAREPGGAASLGKLLNAGNRVFADPQGSWDLLDLESMVLARVDPEMAHLARDAVNRRAATLAELVAAERASGFVDPQLSDQAIVHLTLVLSAGLSLISPALAAGATAEEWAHIQTRIALAMAPVEGLLGADPGASALPWWIRLDLPIEPGSSARLFRALAALGASTTFVQVVGATDELRALEVGVRAPESVSSDMLVAAASTVGRNVHITQGSPIDGIDVVARVLDAATLLLRRPEVAPQFAATMLGADRFEVVDATAGESDQSDVLRLQWTTQRHVLLHRSWAPFTRTEQARASALLRLAAAAAGSAGAVGGSASGWIEPIRDGTGWIRLARPEDAEQVAQMHERTSEQSRFQRYFAAREWRELQVRRLAGGHRGAALVAQGRDGQIIALGNVVPEFEGSRTAEIALLVEDAAQGRGLGRVLLRRMLEVSAQLGFTEVLADVLADNKGMQRLLETTDLTWSSTISEGVRSMRAPLPNPERD